MAQQVKNPAKVHKDAGSIPDLAQWVKGPGIATSFDEGHRCGLGLMLLWLRYRLAASALIGPLAQELPHAPGEAIKRKKKIQTFKKSNTAL